MRPEEVMRRRTWRGTCIQSLTSHCHTYLTGNGCSTKPGLGLAILNMKCVTSYILKSVVLPTSRMKTGRPSRGVSDSSRTALCESSCEANSTMLIRLLSKKSQLDQQKTCPHPLDTPVGVTSTSANRTSPADNPKRKLLSISSRLDHSINQKTEITARPPKEAEAKENGKFEEKATSSSPSVLSGRIIARDQVTPSPLPHQRDRKTNLRFPHPPPLMNSIRSLYLTS